MFNRTKNTILKFAKGLLAIIYTLGLWVPAGTVTLLFLFTAITSEEWSGVSRYGFILALVIGLCGSAVVTLGNMFLWKYYRTYYKEQILKPFTFYKGFQMFRKKSKADLLAVFPKPNKEMYITKDSGYIFFGENRGKMIGKALTESSGHVCVCAPTGGGKTSNCIINTILNIIEYNQYARKPQGFIAVDIKGDIGAAMKKVCKAMKWKSRVKILNPKNDNTYGFNPYSILRGKDTDDIIEILEEIAFILIPNNPAEAANSFFTDGGRDYLQGALWYYYHYKHLGFYDSIKQAVTVSPIDFAKKMKEQNDNLINVLYTDIYTYAEGESKYLSLFFGEMKRHVNFILKSAAIGNLLQKPDCQCVTVEDILKGKGILFQIKESKITIYSKMVALIFNMFIRSIVDLDEDTMDITPTTFLIDEFPQLPALPSVQKSISTIRSKGVTLVLCTQEPISQIKEVYGEEASKNFLNNCTYKVIYGMLGEGAEYFSREIGEYEKKVTSYHQPLKLGCQDVSITTSFQKERIVTAADLHQLKENRKAVVLSPYGYCQVDVLPWYRRKFSI